MHLRTLMMWIISSDVSVIDNNDNYNDNDNCRQPVFRQRIPETGRVEVE